MCSAGSTASWRTFRPFPGPRDVQTAPRTPSSSRISTAIARSLVAGSRPWWAQKSRSAPPGPLVAPAAGHRDRLRRLRRLRDLGGLQPSDRGRHRPSDLLRRPLPVAVVLAVFHEGLPAPDLLGPAQWADVAVAGDLHPDLPAGLPRHLLLLP